MNLQPLLGRLAAAALLVSSLSTAATAQVMRDAYGNPRVGSPNRQGRAAAPASRRAVAVTNTADQQPIRFGVRAGLNVADISGDAVRAFEDVADFAQGAVSREMRPGFHAGVYATIPLGAGFAIEPGLSYSEKGTVLQGRVPLEQFKFLNVRLTGTGRLAYIDVPVLAKVFVTRGFYVFAGPQASFLVSGKVRAEAGALGFDAYQQDFDIKNQLRTVDFAAVGGLGYQLDNGLGLSAGYDYGLSSLDKNNRFDAQNRVIKASVNYSF